MQKPYSIDFMPVKTDFLYLLLHLNGHCNLRVITHPIPPSNAGVIRCRGGCTTKKGEPGRGAVACIDQLCKTCCNQAANTSCLNNEPRDPCKTHKIDLVHDNPPPVARLLDVPVPPPAPPALPVLSSKYSAITFLWNSLWISHTPLTPCTSADSSEFC